MRRFKIVNHPILEYLHFQANQYLSDHFTHYQGVEPKLQQIKNLSTEHFFVSILWHYFTCIQVLTYFKGESLH